MCLTRLHVRTCTMHTTACVIRRRTTIMELDRCINSQLLRLKFPEMRGSLACTCVARAHAPRHPKSSTSEKHSLNCISVPNFVSLAQSFPKVKVPVHMHSARAAHVHYAPHHEMACTIELRSLNSISVPKLVSIAQNFLKPEDRYRIKFSGASARSLQLTGTVITKAHTSG